MNGLIRSAGGTVLLVVIGLFLANYLTVAEFLLLGFIALMAVAVHRMIVEN